MRFLKTALAICGLATILESSALGAAPTTSQIATAAGRTDLKVLDWAKLSLPETAREAYSVKAMTPDRQIVQLTLDGSGQVVPGGDDDLLQAEALARQKHYGNLTPNLFAELQKRSPTDLVPVAIWAKVYIDYPSRTELMANSAKREAFDTQLKQSLSAGIDPIVRWLNAQNGVTLAQADTTKVTSPLVSATLPVALVQQLGQLDGIAWVDLQTPMQPASVAWYGATNVASAHMMTTGTGLNACVVEAGYKLGGADPYGSSTYLNLGWPGFPFAPTGSTARFDWHAQYVMGIMSNHYPNNQTSVTNANLFLALLGMGDGLSQTNAEFLNQCFQWCMGTGQLASVINFSVQFPDSSFSDSLIDWYASLAPFPLFVAAAGNAQGGTDRHCWNTTFNGLVIGASNDNETPTLSDDTIPDFSYWQNPNPSLNPYKVDYEIPHLVAPGVCVDSADILCPPGTCAGQAIDSDECKKYSGTSLSAPQVSGAAMLVMAENRSLIGKPKAVKAILMASAGPNVDGERFNWLHANSGIDRKDGVGVLDTAKTVTLANSANWGPTKGVVYGEVGLSTGVGWPLGPYNLAPAADGRMRVVLAWDATATCNLQYPNDYCYASQLTADLDLYVFDDTGALVCWSTSYDSSWEGCDFPSVVGRTYSVWIYQKGATQPTTHYGLAWTDVTMPAKPTVQASLGELGGHGSSLTVGWYNGNGESTAVFVTATSSGTPVPDDGTVYLQNVNDPSLQGWENSTFGQGTQIGTSGWYCVYNGPGRVLSNGASGDFVGVDGLPLGTTYRVMVVSYNGYRVGTPTYLTTTTSSNTANYPIQPPTLQASSITVDLPTGWTTNVFVGWNSGNGEATAVFIAEATTSGTPAPVDGNVYYQDTRYPWAQGYTSSDFGQGSQIGQSGWYCVYNGPNNAEIMIQGLQPGTAYRVMAVTYNGYSVINPTYLTATGSGNPVNYLLPPLPPTGVPATPPIACMVLALLLCGAGLARVLKSRGQHAN